MSPEISGRDLRLYGLKHLQISLCTNRLSLITHVTCVFYHVSQELPDGISFLLNLQATHPFEDGYIRMKLTSLFIVKPFAVSGSAIL